MSDKDKKQEEQRLNVQEEQIKEAVENALKDSEDEGAADINIYKCNSEAF